MFVTHNRYMCFRKQPHINNCLEGFKECERFDFEFGDFGFAGKHLHFYVNIPKRYSIRDAEIILKSRSEKRIFQLHPGFKKRYPCGGFWSSYEHHQSIGLTNLEESSQYLRDKQKHHNITVIGQQQLTLT